MNRGGISLRPWRWRYPLWLNRMLLPDTVGTGGDLIILFPNRDLPCRFRFGCLCRGDRCYATGYAGIGISVALKEKCKSGITLRDLVHAIPYYAIQQACSMWRKR